MCEKGSSKADMGCKGACGIFWLGLLPNWQVWHSLHHFATLSFEARQKKCCKILLWVLHTPNDQTLASHVPIPRPLVCVLLVLQSGTLFRLSHYCHKSSNSLSSLCSLIKCCLEMTDLLSPSCFPGMFPFTFLDSFLLKAFCAFSLLVSSNLPSMFSSNVPEIPISYLPCSFMASFFVFIERVTTEAGIIPGNFSANLSIF